jgi:hypothetical protein
LTLKEFFVVLGLQLDDGSFEDAQKLIGTTGAIIRELGQAALDAGVHLAGLVYDTADEAAEIDKLAAIMGVSTDTAQEWAYAVNKTGVSLDDLTQLAAELGENIGEAAGGTGEAADAFKSLGIKTKDAKGNLRAIDEVLFEIADRMSVMENGTKKTGAVTGLFGEEGIKLLPILNKGSGAIGEFMSQAKELGLVMDQETVKAGAALSTQLADLEAILKSLKQAVVGAFITQILEAAQAFKEWYRANAAIIKQRLERVFKVLALAVKPLIFLMRTLFTVISFVIDNFEALAVIVGSVLLAIFFTHIGQIMTLIAYYAIAGAMAIQAALGAAAAWVMAALPIIAIAVLLALVILLAQDIYGWLTGQESLVGALWEKYKDFIKDWLHPNEEDGYLISAIKWILRGFLWVIEEFDFLVLYLEQTWESLCIWMSAAFQAVLDGVKKGLGWVRDVLPGSGLSDAVTARADTLAGIGDINGRFGSGASPAAGARARGAAEADKKPVINPTFKSEIKIETTEGAEGVAEAVQKAESKFWDLKMRELEAGS